MAPLPFIAWHAQMLWLRPHYQFFPLVPIGSAALALAGCRTLGPLLPGPDRVASGLLIGSWLLLAIASFLLSPWLGSVAALAMLAAGLFAVGGRVLLGQALPAWAFLGLGIGLPLNLDRVLIARLQAMTSRISGHALDALGIFHVMEGNVVRVSGEEFGVEDACSGIYSLFSVLFCTLFFAFWTRRRWVHAILTMVAGVFWVLVGNIARVVAVVYVETRWDVDVARSWRHELLGLIAFVATLGLIASSDALFSCWPASFRFWRTRLADWFYLRLKRRGGGETASWKLPEPELRPALDLGGPTRLPRLRRTRLGSWRVAAAFGTLGLLQLLVLTVVLPGQVDFRFSSPWSGSANAASLQALMLGDLPAQSGRFRREDFKTETRWTGSSVGEMSRYWRYRLGDASAIVSVDFPFKGWHELPRCYLAQGWTLQGKGRDHDGADAGGERPSIVAARLAKGPGRHGYLLFCLVDERGNLLEDDAQEEGQLGARLAVWRRLRGGSGTRGRAEGNGSMSSWAYQVQLFLEGEAPPTAAQEDQARAFFRQVLPVIRRRAGADRVKGA